MSADRLREAADALGEKPLFRYVAVVMGDGHRSLVSESVPEVAELLRAVAHEHESFAERVGPAVMEDYDDATFAAALALADTILGSER